MRVAEIGEIWRGDMKEKGKDLPGELTASWPSEIHWWGVRNLPGCLQSTLGPRGAQNLQRAVPCTSGGPQSGWGMLRTPEFKVKALWN